MSLSVRVQPSGPASIWLAWQEDASICSRRILRRNASCRANENHPGHQEEQDLTAMQ